MAGNSLGYLDPGLCTGDQVMPALAMELVPGGVAFNGVHLIWTGFGLAARLRSPAHATPLPPPSSRATAGRCSPPMPPGSCCLPQESPAADGGGMRAAGDAAWVPCAAAVGNHPPIFVQVNAGERLLFVSRSSCEGDERRCRLMVWLAVTCLLSLLGKKNRERR